MRARQVYRLSLLVISISAFINIVVAVRVMLSLRSPVQYNFRVIEPPVITNVVTSGAFNVPLPGVPVDYSPQPFDVSTNAAQNVVCVDTNLTEIAIEAYHYMRVDGSPCFRLNGYNYKVGDLCVYGRVLAVFPERILLEGGGYISNSRRIFDLVPFSPPVVHAVQNNEEVQNVEHRDNS